MDIEQILTVFFRTCTQVFSFDEFFALMRKFNKSITKVECRALLDASIYVYALLNDNFVTLAGIFSYRTFSFKPKAEEVENKLFITGHRALPFVDPAMHPAKLTFVYNGKELPNTFFKTTSGEAMNYFDLYGPEYAAQYICEDEPNGKVALSDLLDDESHIKQVSITAVDMSEIVKNEGFFYGDRINCEVVNWDKGIINIYVIHTKKNAAIIATTDIVRQKWYETLEQKLLENFDLVGPCSCITEQLVMTYMQNLEELCIKDCGSVEELLEFTKAIDFEYYGVETRLWKAGKDVPAVGRWNKVSDEQLEQTAEKGQDYQAGYVSQSVIDSFLKDMIAQEEKTKDNKNAMSTQERIAELADLLVLYTDDERDRARDKKKTISALQLRFKYLKEDYDSFVEYDLAPLRHKACELFKKIYMLIYDVDNTEIAIEKLPSQDVIVLSQVFEHITLLLDMLENETQQIKDDLNEFSMSLEGMEYSFRDVQDNLNDAVEEEKAKDFSVT